MKKVLIIEDDTFLQNLAAKKLTSEGYEVISAGDADSASKSLDEETPDIVLLDLVFPGATDGFGMLKKIRENIKMTKTPVIIFSNLSEDKDIIKARELGATEYMVKSNFTLDELVEKVKSLTA
jgi:DNA-binding response OmpR family regulator